MKRSEESIEKVLSRSLPSASNEQIESARLQVYDFARSGVAEDRDDVVAPRRANRRWIPALAAAIAVTVVSLWIGVEWRSRTVEAVLETSDGVIYRVQDGLPVLTRAGERIELHEIVRTESVAGGTLKLEDGTRVEIRPMSELSLEHAEDGMRILLTKGGVIVNAAKQPSGRHLYVQTKDVTVSVVGTVFLVNAEEEGSRVAVLEGEVRVQQGETSRNLLPGEQVTTFPSMAALPVKAEISWSRHAEEHLALLQQSTVVPVDATETFDVVSIRLTRFTPGGERGTAGGGGGTSIRPSWDPCGGHPNSYFLKFDPSRADISDMTVHGLIAWAYNLRCLPGAPSDSLIGGPGWTRSDGFDIQALIPPGAPAYTTRRVDIGGGRTAGPQTMEPRFRKMLQRLLADRFKLVLRREMREVQAYVLSVAKAGKLAAWKEGDPVTINEMLSRSARTRTDAMAAFPGVALYDIVGAKSPISGLLDQIEHAVPERVVDRTGLTGEFTFYFVFDRRGDRPEDSAPSLATALEKELGLKLELTKVPMEVLVIESVERPSEN